MTRNHQLPVIHLQVVHISVVIEAERRVLHAFRVPTLRREVLCAEFRQAMEFKSKKRDGVVHHSIRGAYGNVPRATVAFAVLPPLDLSCRCEGGLCSLRLWRGSPGDAVLKSRPTTDSNPGSACLLNSEGLSCPAGPCRNADIVSTARRSIWVS